MLICPVFLYMPYPNFLLDLTQCQKPSFQSGLVEIIFCYSFLSPVYTARLYCDPSTSFSAELSFLNLSSELLLYHVLLFSSCNMFFASVTETHAFPQNQVLNSNSVFLCLIVLLLTSDLRAGFHVASYTIQGSNSFNTRAQNYCCFLNFKFPGILNSKVTLY